MNRELSSWGAQWIGRQARLYVHQKGLLLADPYEYAPETRFDLTHPLCTLVTNIGVFGDGHRGLSYCFYWSG
jgi:hypothetical protein